MTDATKKNTLQKNGDPIARIGGIVMRYGLVLILLWIGLLKFTTYEAEGIKPLIENSPFMAWGYGAMGVEGFARFIGVTEIIVAIMIALRPISPRVCAVGSLLAVGIFVITLSFLFTTPAAWQGDMGFPYLSPMPGQFLLKDVMSIGIAIWSLGEAMRASRPLNRKSAE